MDVLLDKLVKVLPPEQIVIWHDLSSTAMADQRRKKYGVRTVSRSRESTLNDTTVPDVVAQAVEDTRCKGDFAWCADINPMFDGYEDAFQTWSEVREAGYDSLSVRYPITGFVQDGNGFPIGYHVGRHWVTTQDVPTLYRWPCTLQILTNEAARGFGFVGRRPFWYDVDGPLIDVKTDADFRLAQLAYGEVMT